ncbi:hypothetical protein FB451DRAFT_1180191 [Mycena latifolia]|nr:hypothetical protein FB451DRAFT_1180191 [Mycena latifolia]
MLDSRDMWSHLFISIAQGSASWVNYPIALEEQIARAGKYPLRVTLISEEEPGYTIAKIFNAITEESPFTSMRFACPHRARALHVPEKLILSVCATAGPLLDRVVMPAHQDFFIQASPADFHHIVSLVQGSQCSLRKFWVNTAPDSMHYRQILLANADIIEGGIMNNVTNVIPSLFVDAAVLLVPRLRRFSIHHEFDLNMRSVLDMVWGRISAGLERLCITTRRSVFEVPDVFWVHVLFRAGKLATLQSFVYQALLSRHFRGSKRSKL